jgi:hypothetical protein
VFRVLAFLFFICAAVTGAVSCFPGPLDETGLSCSDDRPCGDAYDCINSVCMRPSEPDGGGAGPDGGVLNLLSNGDFEEGDPPTGWVAISGTVQSDSTLKNTGSRSARWSPTGPPVHLQAQNPPRSAGSNGSYCFSGFFRGNANVILQLGGSSSSLLPVTSTAWTKLQMNVPAPPANTALDLRALVTEFDQELWTDTFELWWSPSSACSVP